MHPGPGRLLSNSDRLCCTPTAQLEPSYGTERPLLRRAHTLDPARDGDHIPSPHRSTIPHTSGPRGSSFGPIIVITTHHQASFITRMAHTHHHHWITPHMGRTRGQPGGASSEARGPTARVPTISPGGAASITPPHQIIAGGYGRRPTIGRRPAACGPCRTSCGCVFIRRSPRLNTALRPRARIGSRPGLAQIRCRTGGGDRGRALPTSRIGRALACAADGRPCSGPGTE